VHTPVAQPDPSADVGALLDGRYRLTALIAQGALAEVWQARDERLSRLVAIRRFRPGTTDVGREQTQIPLLARLNHPGLLTVLDAGVEHDDHQRRRAFLVTELMTAPNLSADLASRRIAPDEVARIGMHVAAALSYAHSCGVVHGRISATNLFVTATQAAPAKLADLGVAGLLTELGSQAQVDGGAAGEARDVQDLACVLLAALDFAGRGHASGCEEQRRVLVEAASASLTALQLSARLSAFGVPPVPAVPVASTGKWFAARLSGRRVSKVAAA
jgi:serine/threonine protein kinase